MAMIKVKQIKTSSGRLENHKKCIKGLGLGRIGRERILEDTPSVRGMINKVSYMVVVESV